MREGGPFYKWQMLGEVGYPPPISVNVEDEIVMFYIGLLVEWFATHNSVQLKVAVSHPFTQQGLYEKVEL